MQLRDSLLSIEDWASKFKIGPVEVELLALRRTVLKNGYLTRDQLYLLSRWKSARSSPWILDNSESYVQEITHLALSTGDDRARIESLTVLDGVQWPTASVVLHLFHADRYPILDFRALWSVNEEVPTAYTFEFWQRYVAFCRELAQSKEICMRVLDRALWQFSKSTQKISH